MAGHIAKNTLYLTSASIAQKFFSFVYFTLIARYVGVGATGLYVTALSFSSLFSILTDLGLTSVLIRESAKDKDKLSEWVNNILALKVIFLATAYGLLNLTIRWLNYPAEIANLTLLSGAVMAIDSISLTFFGALRSQQNVSYEARSVVLSQLVTIFVGAAALYWQLPVSYLIIALALGSLFNAVYGWLALRRNYRFRLRPRLSGPLLKTFFILASPFALAGIFTKVYSYVDVAIISYLLGVREVGLYSIASKITFAWQFVPMAFSAAIYPAFSYYFAHNPERLKETFIRGLRYLSLMALPISVGLLVLADQLVLKIYGSVYAPSVLPLQILLVSLVFAFLDFPIGALLNAGNRQSLQTTAMGVTMAVNIILNLLLLPRLGITGAAISALVGNVVLVSIGAFGVPKLLGRLGWSFWWWLTKNVLAAGLMGLLINLIKGRLAALVSPAGFFMTTIYFLILIGAGAAVYLGFVWLFRLLSKEDWQELAVLIKRQPALERNNV